LLYRKIRYGCKFRRIPLTKGKYAIVDVDDYDKLSADKWHLFENKNSSNFYAARTQDCRNVFMHRRIMNAPPAALVDHINRNGLDNRKKNLRVVTNQQNCWNSDRGINTGSSRYKGVRLDKRSGRWYASIRNNGKKMYLGSFQTEICAACAYDNAARLLRGRFAFLNSDVFGPLDNPKTLQNPLENS
jgi:hypothetical protein